MTPPRKIAVVFLGLLVAGAVRVPLELSLTREMRERRLLPEPLHISTRDKIGQTGLAVALGGLRTLVATFYNLRAYTAFSEDRWRDAEESFDTTVALAPSTNYYWTNGSWHMAYNAAHFYKSDSTLNNLPPLRRQEMWRGTIRKGRAFLERGIQNNPQSWSLQAELGRLLTDRNKFAAFIGPGGVPPGEHFQSAADAYRTASEEGGPAYTKRNWFYNLARIPGKEAEALALGESLMQSRTQRTPTVVGLVFVLRMHLDPAQDGYALTKKLYADDRQAYRNLSLMWEDSQQYYPTDGLALVLAQLEAKLHIPPGESILK